jgi:putative transcriptional regulator
MPIILRLDVMLAKRKVRSNVLARAIGITEANLSLLKSGKVKGMKFETLEAICAYLRCQPGDILEYAPEDTPPAKPSRTRSSAPADGAPQLPETSMRLFSTPVAAIAAGCLLLCGGAALAQRPDATPVDRWRPAGLRDLRRRPQGDRAAARRHPRLGGLRRRLADACAKRFRSCATTVGVMAPRPGRRRTYDAVAGPGSR